MMNWLSIIIIITIMACCVSGMRRKSAMITECVFVPSISILCVFFSHSDLFIGYLPGSPTPFLPT